MTYLFGPVPSRRLGISLGVDIIPYKTCSLNCVYCECGQTTQLTLKRERFVDAKTVLAEMQPALSRLKHLDHITFSGSGEPTLNSELGEIIAAIKAITAVPIAVLTNSTMLHLPGVIHDLARADLLLPSLDAASQQTFERINQPQTGLHIEQIIAGLVELRRQFAGKIYLEVFIVPGLNDQQTEIAALHNALLRIRPDKIQLNTVDRPPAYPGVSSAPMTLLESIRVLWHDLPVEIIKRVKQRQEITSFSFNLEHNILNTISRRPLTIEDITAVTGKPPEELRPYLDILEKEKKIRPQIVGNKIFFATEP